MTYERDVLKGELSHRVPHAHLTGRPCDAVRGA